MRDAALQLETLVHKKAEQDTRADAIALVEVGEIKLNKEDVRTALRLLVQWMQKFAMDKDLPMLSEKMLHIANTFAPKPVEKKVEKDNRPSTQDKKVTVDEKKEDSILFFVLETLHKVFAACTFQEGYYRPQDVFDLGGDDNVHSQRPGQAKQQLGSVPATVIEFCFANLHHTRSGAVRFMAGECLGVLSKCFLSSVLHLFTEKCKNIKKEKEEREFAGYQKAIHVLDFGVGTREQIDVTIGYLNDLVKLMKKVERGVLRQEICSSLKAVFSNILAPGSEQRQAEWEEFARKFPKSVDDFFRVYEEIYDIVAKWSSKSKHTLFSYDLLWKMVVLHKQYSFYASKKRFDIFTNLVKGFSKDEFRMACMEYTRNYIRELPMDCVKQDLEAFTNNLKFLFSNLFVKNKTPDQDEAVLMTDMVTQVARRHLHFVVNDVMVEMLKLKAPYSTVQKAILLRGLGTVAGERPAELVQYHYVLGPLIAPYIEDQNERRDRKEPILLRAALSCFPHVRQPQAERVQITAAAIGHMTLHSDREIATAAAMCLQQFMMLRPKDNLIPTIYCLADLLRDGSAAHPELLLKTCHNLSFVLNSVKTLMAEARDKGESAVLFASLFEWIGLRQYVESVCLQWLCHPEGWVRMEFLRLLELLCCAEFRALQSEAEEKEREHVPFLIDYLVPGGDLASVQTNADAFWQPLGSFLREHFDVFPGVISSAFMQLQQYLDEAPKMVDGAEEDGEWYGFFKNALRFLVQSIRPSPEGESAPSISDEAKSLKSPKKKDPNAEPVLVSIAQPRANPRLDRVRLSLQHTTSFYEKVYQLLHLHDSNPPASSSSVMAVREVVLAVSHIHHSCYAELTRHLRRPLLLDDQIAQLKPHKKGLLSASAFYYHEHTIGTFACLIAHMSPQLYHSSSSLLTQTVDEMVNLWCEQQDSSNFRDLSLRSKHNISSLLAQLLSFRSALPVHQHHHEHVSKDAVLSKRAFYFDFITSRCMPVRSNNQVVAKQASPKLSYSASPSHGPSSSLSLGESGAETVVMSNDEAQVFALLETSVIAVLCSLIALAPINDLGLENKFLSFLHRLPLHATDNSHLYQACCKGLELFLRMNPHRLGDFVFRASPEGLEPSALESGPQLSGKRRGSIVHSPDHRDLLHRDHNKLTNTVLLARLYLHAVVTNWITDLERWVVQYHVSPSAMLMETLVHMISPDPQSRILALRMAQALAKRGPASASASASGSVDGEREDLEPGFPIRLHTHQSPFMYMQTAIAHSTALACKVQNLRCLPLLLREVTLLNTYVVDTKKEMVLRLIRPWIAQFGPYLQWVQQKSNNDEKEVNEAARCVLDYLTTITRQCYGSSMMNLLLEDLWVSLFASAENVELIAHHVVHFVLNLYIQVLKQKTHQEAEGEQKGEEKAEESEAPQTPVKGQPNNNKGTQASMQDQPLLKMIFVQIARSPYPETVLKQLVGYLRHYEDESSLEPTAFVEAWQSVKPCVEVVRLPERAAFELLLNFLYEAPLDVVRPYLPLLMQNACVLYNKMSEGRDMLDYIAMNLCLVDYGQEAEEAQQQSISEEALIGGIIGRYPTLREEWAVLAFTWAYVTKDNRISATCFKLFEKLQQRAFHFGPGQRLLNRLVLSCYNAMRTQQINVLKQLVDILLMPTAVEYDGAGWKLVVVLAWAMMTHSNTQYFVLGAMLMNKMLSRTVSSQLQDQWLLEIQDVFLPNSDNPHIPNTLEQGVSDVLFKGLTSPITSELSYQVLIRLANSFMPVLSSKNKILLLAMCGSVFLRCMDVMHMTRDKLTASMSTMITEQQKIKQQHSLVKKVTACVDLSLTLTQYAEKDDHDGGQVLEFLKLAHYFKQLALSLLTEVDKDKVEVKELPANHSAEQEKAFYYQSDLSALVQRVQMLDEVAEPSAWREEQKGTVPTGMDGQTLPTSEILTSNFFFTFARYYTGEAEFYHVYSWLCKFLLFAQAQPDGKHVLYQMMGNLLQYSPHSPNKPQFAQLSELLISNYVEEVKEAHVIENIAFLMVYGVRKGAGDLQDMFNFIRPKTKKVVPRVTLQSTLCDIGRDLSAVETQACLTRLRENAFPIMSTMLASPRALNGRVEGVSETPAPIVKPNLSSVYIQRMDFGQVSDPVAQPTSSPVSLGLESKFDEVDHEVEHEHEVEEEVEQEQHVESEPQPEVEEPAFVPVASSNPFDNDNSDSDNEQDYDQEHDNEEAPGEESKQDDNEQPAESPSASQDLSATGEFQVNVEENEPEPEPEAADSSDEESAEAVEFEESNDA